MSSLLICFVFGTAIRRRVLKKYHQVCEDGVNPLCFSNKKKHKIQSLEKIRVIYTADLHYRWY